MTRLVRSELTSVRLVQRARIVLLAGQGMQNKDIADVLGVGRVQVGRWRDRYAESGLEGIERDLRRGAPPVKVDVCRLVELATQITLEAATHWSTRKLAAVLGVSAGTAMRHWQAYGLKRLIAHGFKVSRDPNSSTSSRTSWGCTCPRPNMHWCCAATRRARCRVRPAKVAYSGGDRPAGARVRAP